MSLIAAFAILASACIVPVASAFTVGIDAKSVDELTAAGGKATHSQVWVGKWVKSSGWGSYESDLRAARDAGTIPVVLWYYWGDDISPNAVKYGKDGMTKGDWDSMAKEVARRANAIMGSKPFLIVLEPEFNKGGISSWETFDGYLENQANIIKAAAPNAQIVVGFGHWGGWDIFDRAMSKATYSGTQLMRASTRDSASEGENMADQALSVTKQLKAKFGKDVILYDLAVASYGGWEGVQERAIKKFETRRAELDAAGLRVVVYRYMLDNCNSSGYFGPAECYWGLKTKSGYAKPAWNDFVALSRGGSSTSTSTTTSSTSSSSGSFDASFNAVKVDEWWVQASVKGTKSIAKVEARISGGSWVQLDDKGWGYAKSMHVRTGQTVEFRATATDGTTDTSSTYARGGAVASSSSTSSSTSSSSGSFDATFSGVKVDEWWVQASVKGTKSIAKVEARISGGSWQTLDNKGWGYAKSMNVKTGQTVEFRATATDGTTDTSSAYARGGTPASSTAGSSGSLSASFNGVKVSEWWVQVDVDASKSIASVHARVNGGSWIQLDDKGWAHAKSIHVKTGQSVEFRATATDGTTATSAKFWR